MLRIAFVFLLGLTLTAAGCGYGSHNYSNGNGMLQITALQPNTAQPGSGAFMLTVNGMGFGTDSTVYWGTSPRTTTYVSTTQVTAEINASDIMNAGMVQVYVRSGGMNSNAVSFTVQ